MATTPRQLDRYYRGRWSALALFAGVLAACHPPARLAVTPDPGSGRVRLETDLGAIEIEIDRDRAPVTAANFLGYVDRGFYDGGEFHRTVRLDNQPDKTVKIEVVQAGADKAREAESFPAIVLEPTSATGLNHRDGTVSMARDGPDSATSDFFICIGDQPELDFAGARNPDRQGFAAFGRVVQGMDVVAAIHLRPAEGQSIRPPVRILRARRHPG